MRSTRNFSPYEAFRELASAHQPRHAFGGDRDFEAWKAGALPEVINALGHLPRAVPPNSELIAEFTDGEIISQRWIIDVEEGLSAILVVNRSASVSTESPMPAIMCWHGHSGFGKEPVMGNLSSPELQNYVSQTGVDYGRSMARLGYVTFGIDWMGQGDQDDGGKPNNRGSLRGDRDWCNVYYLNATLLGYTPMGMNLTHGIRAIDFVTSLDYVDGDRLGVMGESSGGTLALWTTLLDARILATEIICYSDSFYDFALRDLNYCGSQITPRLLELVDVSDLQGLIAPRPLLTDIAAYDQSFRLESAVACVDRVAKIYDAANARDKLEAQVFNGGHGWQQKKSEAFFGKYL